MDPVERKAFLYSRAQFNGGTVDWKTGAITFPRAP